MSSVCITIPDNTYYLFIVSSAITMVSTILHIFGCSCPFISNMIQNRILHRNTGLLELVVDQVYAQRARLDKISAVRLRETDELVVLQ